MVLTRHISGHLRRRHHVEASMKANEWDLLKRQFDALRGESVGAESIEEIFDIQYSSSLHRIDK
jgi:hypothetical protein